MSKEQLVQSFTSIEKKDEESDTYKVISVDGLQHKLGKSSEEFPVFFVKVDESNWTPANVVREFLIVEYNKLCRFCSDDSQTEDEDKYVVIMLRSKEQTLQESFIEIVNLMLHKLQPVPTNKELATEVEKLITIFSALSKEPIKKMQGLWGELLLIERSRYPETLIGAWHSSPTAKYDFTLGRDKIEVKTTSSENRIHHFSLDQLNPSDNSRLLIASICVRESGNGNGGLTVGELFHKICEKVKGANEQIHLYEIMAKTIGKDISKLNNISFDYVEACDSVKMFLAEDVPHIDKATIPPMVSDVKFTSNLTNIQDIHETDKVGEYKKSDLFAGVL